jgi:hypothetical protein
MALTRDEMEAKLAAMEDRLGLLWQFVESLEARVERKEELWTDWVLILRAATTVIESKAARVDNTGVRKLPESLR